MNVYSSPLLWNLNVSESQSLRVSNGLCIYPSILPAPRISSSPEPFRYSMKTKELSTRVGQKQKSNLPKSPRRSIESIIREWWGDVTTANLPRESHLPKLMSHIWDTSSRKKITLKELLMILSVHRTTKGCTEPDIMEEWTEINTWINNNK